MSVSNKRSYGVKYPVIKQKSVTFLDQIRNGEIDVETFKLIPEKAKTKFTTKVETGFTSSKEARAFLNEKLKDLGEYPCEDIPKAQIYLDTVVRCGEYSSHSYCQAGFEVYVDRDLYETVNFCNIHDEL